MASLTDRSDVCEGDEDEEKELDPRIRVELESLNQAATDVNCLEKEINEARAKYQVTFSECSNELEALKNKYGDKIKKARPYYEIKEQSKEAQSEALRSARKFQSANSIYLAAKETISLAELRLMDDKAANLSTAWQEMLNHAVIRVMEAEKEKSKSEKEHLYRAAVFAELEKKLHTMEKKYKKSIEKTKPYFDSKNELELKLQQIKQTIEDFQLAMQNAKLRYSNSLKRLETISDGIHEIRRKKLMLMYPREPGVGAEEGKNDNLEELPTLKSSYIDVCNADISSCEKFPPEHEDEEIEEESDEDECSKNEDMDNEKEFRQKVLTCPLDSEESIFGKPREKTRNKLIKTSSLPAYLREEPVCEDISTVFWCSKDCSGVDYSVTDVKKQQNFNIQNSGECDEKIQTPYQINSEGDSVRNLMMRVDGEGEVSDSTNQT